MTLEIAHHAVRRGRRTVLEAGRITVDAPAALAVVGVNGSGKSSLFMQLTDTLSSRGRATIALGGRQPTTAYVPQVPGLPDWLDPEQTAELYGLRFGDLVHGMAGLHLAEIAGQRVSRLSTGQRQVLAIALALGREADVTLLDEPFSALDFRRRLGTLELLRQCRDAGRAIVMSSQSAADLTEVCDHFVVIRDGRYIFAGRGAELDGGGDARRIEQRLLDLLTMPASAMEAPLRES
jgi:ABC-2 type transport system ATP-binding protein